MIWCLFVLLLVSLGFLLFVYLDWVIVFIVACDWYCGFMVGFLVFLTLAFCGCFVLSWVLGWLLYYNLFWFWIRFAVLSFLLEVFAIWFFNLALKVCLCGVLGLLSYYLVGCYVAIVAYLLQLISFCCFACLVIVF